MDLDQLLSMPYIFVFLHEFIRRNRVGLIRSWTRIDHFQYQELLGKVKFYCFSMITWNHSCHKLMHFNWTLLTCKDPQFLHSKRNWTLITCNDPQFLHSKRTDCIAQILIQQALWPVYKIYVIFYAYKLLIMNLIN